MLALILVLALQDEVVKESAHEMAPGAALTVRTVVGRVRLYGTDEKTARVRTVKRGADRDRVDIRVEGDKDRLAIEAQFPRKHSGLDIDIEIDVHMPQTAKRLDADVVSGSIEVKDARGDATLKSVSGPLRVEGLDGDLTATTISGDIRIARLSAEKASLSLTSGTLEGAGELRHLDITSVSGDVSFDVTPKGEAWSVKSSSVSGDLALRFAAKAGAKADLKTLSGRLSADLDLKDKTEKGDVDRALRGTFGDGAGSVRASTISGDVTLGRIK